jgi:hypothetical protein
MRSMTLNAERRPPHSGLCSALAAERFHCRIATGSSRRDALDDAQRGAKSAAFGINDDF